MTATILTGVGLFALVLPRLEIPNSYIPAVRFGFTTVSAGAAFVYARWRDQRAPHRDKLVRLVD